MIFVYSSPKFAWFQYAEISVATAELNNTNPPAKWFEFQSLWYVNCRCINCNLLCYILSPKIIMQISNVHDNL